MSFEVVFLICSLSKTIIVCSGIVSQHKKEIHGFYFVNASFWFSLLLVWVGLGVETERQNVKLGK